MHPHSDNDIAAINISISLGHARIALNIFSNYVLLVISIDWPITKYLSQVHLCKIRRNSGQDIFKDNQWIQILTLLTYDYNSKSHLYCTGFPDTNMTFDFTGINIESIKKELPLKKKELDSKFNVDS